MTRKLLIMLIGRGIIATFAIDGFMKALRWIAEHLPVEAGGLVFVLYLVGILLGFTSLTSGIVERWGEK